MLELPDRSGHIVQLKPSASEATPHAHLEALAHKGFAKIPASMLDLSQFALMSLLLPLRIAASEPAALVPDVAQALNSRIESARAGADSAVQQMPESKVKSTLIASGVSKSRVDIVISEMKGG